MGLPQNSGIELYSKWPKGERNLITDVEGVTVGHVTLQDGDINTGVTAILPHQGNLFQDKVMAGVSVINGFGKSAGIVQIQELGTIETPIIMTNTLSVGTAVTALVKYMLAQNEDIGVSTGTVNALVTECNDGRLNDIRGLHVTEDMVLEALRSTDVTFEEGAVGSGTGMCCLGVKGGIGSASRKVASDGKDYTIGALVMSNFGADDNLTVGGKHIGKKISEQVAKDKAAREAEAAEAAEKKDQGSIIILLATDIPLNERQLTRVAKRAAIALGRTGSYLGNGSGDIAIAFTTANRLSHYSEKNVLETKMFYDENIDIVFEPAVEAVEEAVISSLYHARTTKGIRGNLVRSLKEYIENGILD